MSPCSVPECPVRAAEKLSERSVTLQGAHAATILKLGALSIDKENLPTITFVYTQECGQAAYMLRA